MSTKQLNIQTIALTTGGTVNITSGVPANPMLSVPSLDSICTEYRITGTQALAANFIIAMTGTPAQNTRIRFVWLADATPGAFSVQILGKTIPADYLDKTFSIVMTYVGVAWTVEEFNLDLSQTGQLPGDRLVSASVATSQLTDKAVSYAKFQDVGAYSVPVRNAGTSGVLSELAVAAQSVIGRVAAGLMNITASVNGTVLKMTGGNIGFAQLDFNELAGTIANAQIPDREIALAKMDSTGLLHADYTDAATTAVTTEEVLYTYTLPAGIIANDGEGVEITASGIYAGNANDKTVRIKLGGETYATNSVTTSPNGVEWYATVQILRTGAATSRGIPLLLVGTTSEALQKVDGTPTWANSNAIEVTGQNGTANAGDIVAHSFTVKVLR